MRMPESILAGLLLILFSAQAHAAAQARARLTPTEGNTAKGTLTLERVDDGVAIRGRIEGLAPSTAHGFHIHQDGDCSAKDASSAGAHLNPGDHPHGGPATPARHLGDLPNLAADAQGVAMVDTTVAGATLGDGGKNDLILRAFIVHAAADDYATQPTGNSGARIACGVVQ